jgi:hypothetical protein
MESIRTLFDSPKHSFKFLNRFDLADFLHFDLPIDIPFLRQRNPLNPLVYGLCGGMCFAALDYFYASKSIPTWDDPDEINYRLFSYLWQRQIDSMSPYVVGNVISWMILDDKWVLQKTIKDEIPKLLEELRSARPTVLVLIRSAGTGNPTLNHQVLATGFDLDPDTNNLSVFLYDPNQPQVKAELNIKLAKPGRKVEISQPNVPEPTRGFFISPYTTTTPK